MLKKANKDKLVEAYELCFEKGAFGTEEERQAERLAQEMEKAKLEEAKSANQADKSTRCRVAT